MKFNFDLDKLPEMEQRARKKFIIVIILFPIAISFAFDKQLGISENPFLYSGFFVSAIFISISIYYSDLKGARAYRTYYIKLTDNHLVVSLNNKNLREIHYSQILDINLNEHYFNVKTLHNKHLGTNIYAAVEQPDELLSQLQKRINKADNRR